MILLFWRIPRPSSDRLASPPTLFSVLSVRLSCEEGDRTLVAQSPNLDIVWPAEASILAALVRPAWKQSVGEQPKQDCGDGV